MRSSKKSVQKDDKDARFGHKTTTSTFYGYKNHIAMTEERLIAGISVTHGGQETVRNCRD